MFEALSQLETKLTTSASLDCLTAHTSKNEHLVAVHDHDKVGLLALNCDGHLLRQMLIRFATEEKRSCIIRIKLIGLIDKSFLVVVSFKTVKIYLIEGDYKLLYNHSLNLDYKTVPNVHSIEMLNKNTFCIATQSKLYFYTVTNSGNNFQLKDLNQDFLLSSRVLLYKLAICSQNRCALIDNTGTISIWKLNEKNFSFTKLSSIGIHPNTKATCVQIYRQMILIGTISGQIQIVDLSSGELVCEIQAHVKCVTSIHVAGKSGHLISASEDSYVRVFRLSITEDCQCEVEHLQQINLPNEMICGVQFLHSNGEQFAVSTYESSQIKLFQLQYE